jgi:hypothetical protein
VITNKVTIATWGANKVCDLIPFLPSKTKLSYKKNQRNKTLLLF